MSDPAPAIHFDETLAFRSPMRVSAIRAFRHASGLITFPVCPRCQITLEREYQAYCDRCGQALNWCDFAKAVVILADK